MKINFIAPSIKPILRNTHQTKRFALNKNDNKANFTSLYKIPDGVELNHPIDEKNYQNEKSDAQTKAPFEEHFIDNLRFELKNEVKNELLRDWKEQIKPQLKRELKDEIIADILSKKEDVEQIEQNYVRQIPNNRPVYVIKLDKTYRKYNNIREVSRVLGIPLKLAHQDAKRQTIGVREGNYKCIYADELEIENKEGEKVFNNKLFDLLYSNFCENSFYAIRKSDKKYTKFNNIAYAARTLGLSETQITTMLNKTPYASNKNCDYFLTYSKNIEFQDENGDIKVDIEKLDDELNSIK